MLWDMIENEFPEYQQKIILNLPNDKYIKFENKYNDLIQEIKEGIDKE